MFGDLGSLGKIMQIAGQLKTKLPEMLEQMDAAEFVGQSGGGAVTATVNGKMKLKDLKFSDDLKKDGQIDLEMLEDLVKAAVSSAQTQASDAMKAQFREITGGVDLGGMGKLFG